MTCLALVLFASIPLQCPPGAERADGRHRGGVQCGVWKTWDADGRLLGTVE